MPGARHTASGVWQIGSRELNLDMREALDELGLMYDGGQLTLEQASGFARMVRAGAVQGALFKARMSVLGVAA